MKRAEYEAKATAFRALLNEIASRPQNEQDWPDFPDWLSVPGTSTCTTPTCVVFGQPFRVTLHENADGIFRGMCGQCGNPITPVPDLED